MDMTNEMTALPGIDWADIKRRHDAVYAGKTGAARLAIDQVTAAWNETFALHGRMREAESCGEAGSDSARLEAASRAEKALGHYWAVARVLGLDPRSPDAMAECCRRMDGFVPTCRAARWSCPPARGTLAEYRWLVGLLEDRAKLMRTRQTRE